MSLVKPKFKLMTKNHNFVKIKILNKYSFCFASFLKQRKAKQNQNKTKFKGLNMSGVWGRVETPNQSGRKWYKCAKGKNMKRKLKDRLSGKVDKESFKLAIENLKKNKDWEKSSSSETEDERSSETEVERRPLQDVTNHSGLENDLRAVEDKVLVCMELYLTIRKHLEFNISNDNFIT